MVVKVLLFFLSYHCVLTVLRTNKGTNHLIIILFPGIEGVETSDTYISSPNSCFDGGGTCHNVQNDHVAQLDQTKPNVAQLDPCSEATCQGGGTCESHDGTFTCYCPKTRTGKFCERELVSSVSEHVSGFTGSTRVSLVNTGYKHNTPKYSIRFRFKPLSGEGVIVHSGDTLIALHNGHLQLSYGHGNSSETLVLQSSYPLTLNTWHEASIQTYHADVMMQVLIQHKQF